MKSRLVWALVALNAVLVIALAVRWMKPQTVLAAQGAAAARPGDYIMVPAEVVGGSSTLIFVIDTSNNQLSGMAFDQNQLKALPPIDLARWFNPRAVEGAAERGR